jgi:glycosyltransferase involved in cell wall biosynthesis
VQGESTIHAHRLQTFLKRAAASSRARLLLPEAGPEPRAGDEVVTYVARNLEPYRGFRTFMRSLPAILEQRSKAHVLVVGGDAVSYGPSPTAGRTFKQEMLDQVGSSLDLKRVHFLGKVAYATYLKVLQISRVRVYLTYPFVLSWSMLEAMRRAAWWWARARPRYRRCCAMKKTVCRWTSSTPTTWRSV